MCIHIHRKFSSLQTVFDAIFLIGLGKSILAFRWRGRLMSFIYQHLQEYSCQILKIFMRSLLITFVYVEHYIFIFAFRITFFFSLEHMKPSFAYAWLVAHSKNDLKFQLITKIIEVIFVRHFYRLEYIQISTSAN